MWVSKVETIRGKAHLNEAVQDRDLAQSELFVGQRAGENDEKDAKVADAGVLLLQR